jgi:hypothetical protein
MIRLKAALYLFAFYQRAGFPTLYSISRAWRYSELF